MPSEFKLKGRGHCPRVQVDDLTEARLLDLKIQHEEITDLIPSRWGGKGPGTYRYFSKRVVFPREEVVRLGLVDKIVSEG
jgi:hypothetical protein